MPTTTAQAQRSGSQRYEIAAVSNALAIIAAMAEKQSISLADAGEAAGVPKSTAYRLLATLQSAQVAEQLPEGGYRPGPEAIRWAIRVIAGLDVRSVALPFMQELRSETGETVNLALIRGSSLVYVEILESPSPFRIAETPGSQAPMHATALGRAIARHLDPSRLAAMLGPEPYEAFTDRTPRTMSEFRQGIAISDGRFTIDLEEVAVGVVCVAAPILVAGRAMGALSVSMPRARCSDARLEEIGLKVAEVASVISGSLATIG